ncbi:MAG TPA: TetR family transcriptional regulator [Jatrophihabitantaceae bacterium]|nr:TetR family transcriptional regulator [Jatrophihabitantaceae bacterium]
MSNLNPDEKSSPRPTRKDALRNRQLLIQSAREVFALRGLEASMDDVAHHAGLGVGTAYRHFANKHELASAIFENAVDEIVELAEQALAMADPWDGLVTFLEATLNAQTLNRALREILTGIYDDGRDRHNARITAPFAPLVERAKAAGALRPDAEPSDVSLIVVMLCTLADASSEQSPYLWRRYLPMLLAGLRDGAAPMPVPALTPEQLREALTARSRRPVRVGD